jgi:hypothetical protein
MSNRTIQILGYGYGSTTCSATVNYNGATVFSGTIPTLDQAQVSLLPTEQVELFSFEIDVNTAGSFPLIINVTGGNTVYIEQVLSNYMPVQNPVYSASDWTIVTDPASTSAQKLAVFEPLAVPPLSEADIAELEQGTTGPLAQAVLAAHGISYFVSSGATSYLPISRPQAKSNVVINGTSLTPGDPPPGEWGWEVPIVSGTGTLACDLNILAGLA